MNNELIGVSIVGRGGLHFDRVVTVSKLGKPKASDTIERVDGIEKAFVVMSCSQFEDGTTEEIELDRHLGRNTTVHHPHGLVNRKDPVWIMDKVSN